MKPADYAAILAGVARVEAARRLGRATIPYKLEFIITFSCASRCRTCNIWRRYLEAPEDRERELSAADIVKTAASARRDVRWISLTGGEVTERDDVVAIVEGLMGAVGDRLALLQLTTNGTEPERTRAVFGKIAAATRGTPLYVTLSLDGIGPTYERVRGVPDGYRKVKASMAYLREIARREPHLETGFQITLSSLNAHEADALFADASDEARPIITLAVNALQLTGGRVDVDVRRAGPEVRAALLRFWRRYPWRSPKDWPPRFHLALARRFFETGRAPLACAAGHAALTIDPYGGVLQCDSRAEPLAQLADYDFDLPALCRSAAFRHALAPFSGCRECWTPCHAYPALLHHPAHAIAEYARAVLARRRR